MSEVTQNPPVAAYFAALVGAVGGWSELSLHLGFLLPAMVLILGTCRLASLFTSRPLLAALVTLFTPGVLVSASSVGSDVMMVAIWVWAAVFWVEGTKREKPFLLLASAFLLALAELTKYFAVSEIALLFAYSAARDRRIGRWALYLLMPIAILAAYHLWTQHLYGHGLLLSATSYANKQRQVVGGSYTAMALVGLSFCGGCASSAVFLAPFMWRPRVIAIGIAVGTLAACALVLGWVNLTGSGSNSTAFRVRHQHWLLIATQLGMWIAGGISILGLAITDWLRERDADSLFLALWVLGTIFFAAFLNWTVNARSILPLIPAVGVLVARRAERSLLSPVLITRATRWAIALLIAASLSFLVAGADEALADSARQAAHDIYQKTGANGDRLWFAGHWGFQYYMELFGAHALNTNDSRIPPGAIVVIPTNNTGVGGIKLPPVASQTYQEIPLQSSASTICPQLSAGFYSSLWGPLPFVIGAIPPEEYLIFQLP